VIFQTRRRAQHTGEIEKDPTLQHRPPDENHFGHLSIRTESIKNKITAALFQQNPTQSTMKMRRLLTAASLAGFLTVVLTSSRPKGRYTFSENL